MNLIPVGTVARAARNIGDSRLTLPYIYAGEEVTVQGHTKIQGSETPWQADGYIICNREGLRVIASRKDVTLEPVPPPKSIEKMIQEAFREGYSRGHSRGLTCGKLYSGDDQYRSIIHVETISYLQELRDESDC